MSSQKILKGSVNYNKFIWVTSANACEKCQELNGKEFTSIDEILDKPHPNCKCFIDYVEEKNIKNNELCDCYENINILDKIIADINSMRDELRQSISNISNTAKIKLGSMYENLCQKYLDEASQWDNVLGDFAKNYNDMVEANTINADKYFHAKANCQAAQRGLTSEYVSQAQSILRELEEGTRKVIFEGEDLTIQYNDALEDIKANNEGRELGKNNPTAPCKDLLKHKRPNGLDDKY